MTRDRAIKLLTRAEAILRQEYATRGKSVIYDAIHRYVPLQETPSPPPRVRETAEKLHMSEGATRVAIHRLRSRCRDIVRDLIAHENPGGEDDGEDENGVLSLLNPTLDLSGGAAKKIPEKDPDEREDA